MIKQKSNTVHTSDGYSFGFCPDGKLTDGDMTFNSLTDLMKENDVTRITGCCLFCGDETTTEAGSFRIDKSGQFICCEKCADPPAQGNCGNPLSTEFVLNRMGEASVSGNHQ